MGCPAGAVWATQDVAWTMSQAPELAALATDSRLPEISGLAVSRRHEGIIWMHNDGPDKGSRYAHNTLHAVDLKGTVRATLRLPLDNLDWEDMASFEHEGRAYLLLADTGDNGGVRDEVLLHVIGEPGQLRDADVPPQAVRTIRFRWPDGARDCEAVAVDAREGAIYLVSKKRVPPELFRLPLWPQNPALVQVAQRLGRLSGIVQPRADELARSPRYGKYRSQISAADISADGAYLAVISYQHLYLWPRRDKGWAQAVSANPLRRELPWMAQAEAMGFAGDSRSLWLSSERLPAPLIRMQVPADRAVQ